VGCYHSEYNGYGAPRALEEHWRRVKLILVLRPREGFIEEKLAREGWIAFSKQERGM
jgi:hypothetical protein